MTKLIAFLLALVMVLSLCACGQNSKPSDNQTAEAPTEAMKEENAALTQEEMVAESTELTDEMWKKITENKAYASSLVGTTFSFMACVEEITTDYVVMNVVNSELVVQAYAMQLHVYLPTAQLIELETGLFLQMVGNVTEMTEGELTFLGPTGNKTVGPIYVMEQAYVVEDRFEFEGELLGENDSYGGWNIVIGDSNYAKLIYFADDVDTSELKYTQKIKFTAQYTGSFINARIEEAAEATPDERLLTFSYEDREFFKEYVKTLSPMAADEVSALLTGNTFKMRNNYGGDEDGTHTITFFEEGKLDANYTYEGEVYSMYESWQLEDSAVIMQHSFKNTSGEMKTLDYMFEIYRYDDTRVLMICYDSDASMVLTVAD